ncbi:MAG: glycosyltransferase family 2 protein [Labilithrix sp.]|nr:glycosyltransferase family 2 protein [Labilithrix sp.]
MSEPRVTVLVPTIGRMAYLPAAKLSLASQTWRDYRVRVLDNASPLEARTFLEQWAAEDDRVTIDRVDERIPMFANFNRGMRAARTELVTFVHDDDVYLPRYLEVLAGALEANPGAAFSGSNFDFVDEDGRVIEERRWIRTTELWSGARYVAELVGRNRNPVPMPGLVFRRRAFGPDGFDESLPIHFGDFVLLMRAAEEGGMVACDERVVQIRKHAAQASALPLSGSIGMRTELMASYLDEYGARHPAEAPLVARLRRRVALAHRVGLVWGWLSSEDPAERAACLEQLGRRPPDAVVRSVLRWADRRGLRPKQSGARLTRVARVAAERLRF